MRDTEKPTCRKLADNSGGDECIAFVALVLRPAVQEWHS